MTMILCITADWWNAFAGTVTAIATLLLVFVAYSELRKLNESNKTTNIIGVLDFDAEISKRKIRLDKAAYDIESYSITNPVFDNKYKLLNRILVSAIEDYLNSVDRLSYCILNDYFPEIKWKREYGKVISDAVETYESQLGQASNFINIIDLHNKWKRE